jgi:DNA-binding GntR family transcriptional regulator
MYETMQIILATAKGGRMNCNMGQLEYITEALTPIAEIAENGEETSVYGQIRHDILAGRLTGNERLKVSTLAAQYQTSTNPVREALQQLRGEGFVVISPNRGARVRTIDETYVRDIYEIEVLVEPYLIRSFVGLCSASNVAELEAIQAEIEALNFADSTRHSQLDSQFHLAMYGNHYNRSALALWWRHREILRAINVDHGTSLRRQRDVIEEHRALIQAVKDHDEDRAAEAIARHVQGSGRHIIDRMRAQRARTPG